MKEKAEGTKKKRKGGKIKAGNDSKDPAAKGGRTGAYMCKN